MKERETDQLSTCRIVGFHPDKESEQMMISNSQKNDVSIERDTSRDVPTTCEIGVPEGRVTIKRTIGIMLINPNRPPTTK